MAGRFEIGQKVQIRDNAPDVYVGLKGTIEGYRAASAVSESTQMRIPSALAGKSVYDVRIENCPSGLENPRSFSEDQLEEDE